MFLSIIMTFLVGVIGIAAKVADRELYSIMAVCLVVFYLLGLFLRNTIAGINGEIEKRKEMEERKAMEAERLRLEQEAPANGNGTGQSVDYRVSDDEFIAMELSKAIKSSLVEDKNKV